MAADSRADLSSPQARAGVSFSLAGYILAISIVGVLLKQVRLIGESLGPFEVAGLCAALSLIAANRARPKPADVHFTRFLIILGLAFGCGAAISAAFFPEHFSPREVVATLYVMVLVLGWINFTEGSLADRIGLLRDCIAIYCGAVLVFAVFGYPVTLFLWFFDTYFGRLMGLSDNPNQLAGLATAGIALTAARASILDRLAPREAWQVAFIVGAGALTQSVTFLLSALVLVLTAVSLRALFMKHSGSRARRAIQIGLFLALVAALCGVVLFGGRLLDGLVELWSGGSAKGATRFAYWMEALEEALWSPLVGLGPGGHVRVEHTEVLQEAHNIFIELFLSGGLLALGAFLFLVVAIGVSAWRQRCSLVFAALLAILALGSFQTVLRHAYLWIVLHSLLSVILTAPSGSDRASS